MFRLSRAVRFAINRDDSDPHRSTEQPVTNSYGGYPSLRGLGHFFEVNVMVAGELDSTTSYLLNIKDIDNAVRTNIVPMFHERIRSNRFGGGASVALDAFNLLKDRWPDPMVMEKIELKLSPFLCLSVLHTEQPMVRLSQKFEFSASHRLHNPALPDADNARLYGKCNNPHGHGHNYELQVTLVGEPDTNGVIMDVPAFERIVDETIIRRLDHKNLNVEVSEFFETMPSVENIARVIYQLLKPKLAGGSRTRLASVTVWETPKTWCEFSE